MSKCFFCNETGQKVIATPMTYISYANLRGFRCPPLDEQNNGYYVKSDETMMPIWMCETEFNKLYTPDIQDIDQHVELEIQGNHSEAPQITLKDSENWQSIPTFQILPFIVGTRFDYDADNKLYLCVIKLADSSTVIMAAEDVEAAHANALNAIKEMAHKNGWLSDGI